MRKVRYSGAGLDWPRLGQTFSAMRARFLPAISIFTVPLLALFAIVAACDTPTAEGPPPATPNPRTATPASTTLTEATPPLSMAPGAVSPPFVPALAAAGAGPRVACPTKVPKHEPIANAPLPSGWVALPGSPDAQALRCGNLSRREWAVKRGASEVEIALAQRRPPDDPLPFYVIGKANEGLAGTRKVKPVERGFLVGFDAGEHGGALWWFGPAGDRRTRLSEENVIGFAELGGVPVAITGHSRFGISRGRVIRLSPDGADAWRVGAWVDLGGASQTFAVESPETMLVLTTAGLVRITACGDMSLLAAAHYDVLYPSSMAVDDSGVVTIGMRQFATRWIPSANGYREEWLVRIDCAQPQVKKFECVCGR
ncbi:hypothetical protein [Pendulispora albinea]|uniref:Uncharacterized protein n=1 Tax=Pendulispora albinea TaxID=2741071 RepID=A0ABZ2M2T0_9BACT